MESFVLDISRAIFKLKILPRFINYEMVKALIDKNPYDINTLDLAYSLFVTKKNVEHFIGILERLAIEGYIFFGGDEINRYDILYKDKESCAKENKESLGELREDIEDLFRERIPEEYYYFACPVNKGRDLKSLKILLVDLNAKLRVVKAGKDFWIVPGDMVLVDLTLAFDDLKILGEISPPDLLLGEVINPLSDQKVEVKIVENLLIPLGCVLRENLSLEEMK